MLKMRIEEKGSWKMFLENSEIKLKDERVEKSNYIYRNKIYNEITCKSNKKKRNTIVKEK